MSQEREATETVEAMPRDAAESAIASERRSIWERIPRYFTVPLFGALLVLAWQVVIWLGVTSELILPSPVAVAEEIASLTASIFGGGFVLESLWVTVKEILLGTLVAAVAGVGLGVLIAETSFGRQIVLPFMIAVNAAPKVAFAPIFVAWLGFGIWSKVAMGAFIAFFPLLIDTAAGLAGVDPDQAKLFRMMRASRVQIFVKMKVPNALPFIFAGLKTASVLAVVGAIVGEFLGGGKGLGQLIRIAGSRLDMPRVFAFAFVLSVLGYGLYAITAWVERRVVFWRSEAVITTAGM